MLKYQRFISYLYDYANHEKGRNAGFIKMEVKAGRCRLQIVLKNIYAADPVYGVVTGIFEQKGKTVLLPLGRIALDGRQGESVVSTASGNFMQQGMDVSQLIAVAVFMGNQEDLFLSVWGRRRVSEALVRQLWQPYSELPGTAVSGKEENMLPTEDEDEAEEKKAYYVKENGDGNRGAEFEEVYPSEMKEIKIDRSDAECGKLCTEQEEYKEVININEDVKENKEVQNKREEKKERQMMIQDEYQLSSQIRPDSAAACAENEVPEVPATEIRPGTGVIETPDKPEIVIPGPPKTGAPAGPEIGVLPLPVPEIRPGTGVPGAPAGPEIEVLPLPVPEIRPGTGVPGAPAGPEIEVPSAPGTGAPDNPQAPGPGIPPGTGVTETSGAFDPEEKQISKSPASESARRVSASSLSGFTEPEEDRDQDDTKLEECRRLIERIKSEREKHIPVWEISLELPETPVKAAAGPVPKQKVIRNSLSEEENEEAEPAERAAEEMIEGSNEVMDAAWRSAQNEEAADIKEKKKTEKIKSPFLMAALYKKGKKTGRNEEADPDIRSIDRQNAAGEATILKGIREAERRDKEAGHSDIRRMAAAEESRRNIKENNRRLSIMSQSERRDWEDGLLQLQEEITEGDSGRQPADILPSKEERWFRRRREYKVTWQDLCRMYPKVLPFGRKDTWEILQIGIQDIGKLPRENWVYGNNRFVVQGYQEHRHLILAKSPYGGIYIGVPGEALPEESRIARLFGFPEYKSAGRKGYWMASVRL